MVEKIIFNLLAFSLFIIIFFKIIRRNDVNYILILILEAIGITISCIEIRLGTVGTTESIVIRYLLSILIPVLIIILEIKGFNFSEILSVCIVKICMLFGNTKLAKTILVNLVTKYPESYYGHKLLAEVYEKEGGMRRAIDEYVTSVDINKKDYKSYYKIAELLRDLGKKDESIQMLETLIKTKPDYYEASCLLGELLCEMERFKEAANVYNEALLYRPSDYDLYYNLGIVYTRLSDFQMAKEMYERAASINHKMYGAKYNLGLIIFIQGDYEAAEQYFKESLYGDLEAFSYYQLAKIYVYKNEKDKAINFLNKAIELEPKLLKQAERENCFESIKSNITVSVKMEDEKEEEFEEEEKNDSKMSEVMKEQETMARKYLEEASKLFEEMNKNASKEKINEKLNYIFNREKNKKDGQQIEENNFEEIVKPSEKDERFKFE